MPASFLHGVETIDVTSGARPVRSVKTAVIGIVGTAPVHLVAAADKTVNKLVLSTSEVDDVKYFGPEAAGFTIPAALKAIRKQGTGIVFVVNVFDPATHKTAVAAESKTFVNDKLTTTSIPLSGSLVVKSNDSVTTYILNTDYTVDFTTGVITRKAGGAILAGATVKVNYDTANPAAIVSADVIGTVTVGGERTGMQAWKDARSKFGYGPKILIAPGYSTQTSIVAELNVLATALRAMAIIDAPAGTTVAAALTGRTASGTINFNTASGRLIPAYPYVTAFDKVTNANVLQPYSQYLAGVMAAKDMEKGYWWSPSNTEIKGIVGIERALTASISDPTCEVNQLNEVGIVTIFNEGGFRTWGNRSAAFPTDTSAKGFINVQRTADVINESIELAMMPFADRPLTQALIDEVVETVNTFMRTLKGRGAIIDGACWFDPADNSAAELGSGHAVYSYDFMPPTPAERFTFKSAINTDYLLSLLGGNA